MTESDAEYMAAGGIEQRAPAGDLVLDPADRAGAATTGPSVDEGVAIAARAGFRVLPFFYGTPRWLAAKPTTLPINNGQARQAWTDIPAAPR